MSMLYVFSADISILLCIVTVGMILVFVMSAMPPSSSVCLFMVEACVRARIGFYYKIWKCQFEVSEQRTKLRQKQARLYV